MILHSKYEVLKNFHKDLPTPPLAMFSFEELMLDYSGVLNDLRGRIENEMDLQVDPNVYNDLGEQRDDLEKRAFEIRQLLGLEDYNEESYEEYTRVLRYEFCSDCGKYNQHCECDEEAN
jgi:hypothetical protein